MEEANVEMNRPLSPITDKGFVDPLNLDHDTENARPLSPATELGIAKTFSPVSAFEN